MEQNKEHIGLFQELLNGPFMMQLRVVSCSLFVGPMIFAVVAVSVTKASDSDIVSLLTMINFIFISFNLLLMYLVPRLLMRGVDLEDDNGIEKASMKIRTVIIGRLALMEASALFSAVVVVMGGSYYNLLAYLPLILLFTFTFPTKAYLTSMFIKHFIGERRLLI